MAYLLQPALPEFHQPAFRPFMCALLAAGLAGWCAPARAADHAAPTPPAAVALAAAPAASATSGAAKSQDPLDRVRERLATKLGAAKPPHAPDPNVVRIVTRAAAPTPAENELHAQPTAAHGAPAAPKATPMGARLAAAHRAAPGVESGGHSGHGAAIGTTGTNGAQAGPAHWDYVGGAGPESWGQMKPEFAKCSSGTRQSPIDIRDGIKVNLDPVQFDYKPSPFRVLDNGHTVQVNVGPGNSIDVAGRRFDLVQFHFHRPSEERINGKQFDMVAHLVHKDIDGRLAVVAVLLDRGSAHPLVQSVWNNLPLEKGDEVAARTTLDMNTLLPTERSYFTYMGSLTTPPCSEGVLWMVMKTPMPISNEQVGIFARLYPMNARPIQSVSGRLIKESN